MLSNTQIHKIVTEYLSLTDLNDIDLVLQEDDPVSVFQDVYNVISLRTIKNKTFTDFLSHNLNVKLTEYDVKLYCQYVLDNDVRFVDFNKRTNIVSRLH